MKSLLERPEQTPSPPREDTPPSPRGHHAPRRKRWPLITLALLLLMVVQGSLLLTQAIAKSSSRPPHHWIDLHLVGTGRSNFAAIGARVTVTAGGKSWSQWIRGQDASQATNPLHFDVETLNFIDQVDISWPDERVERLTGLSVDTVYTLREGDVPSWPT